MAVRRIELDVAGRGSGHGPAVLEADVDPFRRQAAVGLGEHRRRAFERDGFGLCPPRRTPPCPRRPSTAARAEAARPDPSRRPRRSSPPERPGARPQARTPRTLPVRRAHEGRPPSAAIWSARRSAATRSPERDSPVTNSSSTAPESRRYRPSRAVIVDSPPLLGARSRGVDGPREVHHALGDVVARGGGGQRRRPLGETHPRGGFEHARLRAEHDLVGLGEPAVLVGPSDVAREPGFARALVVLRALGVDGHRGTVVRVDGQLDLLAGVEVRREARGRPVADRAIRLDAHERLALQRLGEVEAFEERGGLARSLGSRRQRALVTAPRRRPAPPRNENASTRTKITALASTTSSSRRWGLTRRPSSAASAATFERGFTRRPLSAAFTRRPLSAAHAATFERGFMPRPRDGRPGSRRASGIHGGSRRGRGRPSRRRFPRAAGGRSPRAPAFPRRCIRWTARPSPTRGVLSDPRRRRP